MHCLIMVLVGSLILSQSEAWAVDPLYEDTLENVLREKGVISKEDWVRIQAAKEKKQQELSQQMDQEFPITIGYGRRGFELKSKDGKFATQIQWRFQGRWTYSERGEPSGSNLAAFFNDNPESTFELRRVRMKIGGHGYQPWVKYYFEVDLQSTSNSGGSPGDTRVLDWRIYLDRFRWLLLQFG